MSREWRILLALMVVETVATVSLTIVLPGLAAWLRIFGNPVHVGWIMSAYLLVSAAAAALCGRLGDLFGRKRVLQVVLWMTLIGSIVSALGQGLVWIVAGRALQGVAGALLPLAYGLVREHLATKRVPFGIAMIVTASSASSALCLLIGGMLTDLYGPQSLFVAIAVLTIIGLIAGTFVLPPSSSNSARGSIDWIGGVLFAPGIAGLLIAISNLHSGGLSDATTLGALGLGVTLLGIWHWHERRLADPLIDLRLLGGRNRALANAVMAAIALGAMQITEIVALLLQQPSWTGAGLGTSATLVGLIKFPAIACGILGATWTGWIAGRRGARLPMVAGATLMLFAALVAAVAHDSVMMIFIFVALAMAGITASYAAVPIVIVDETPEARVGEATGLMAVLRAVFQGVGAQIVAVLLSSSTIVGVDGTAYPNATAYGRAFLFLIACGCAALLLALAIRRKSKARSGEPAYAPAIGEPV